MVNCLKLKKKQQKPTHIQTREAIVAWISQPHAIISSSFGSHQNSVIDFLATSEVVFWCGPRPYSSLSGIS